MDIGNLDFATLSPAQFAVAAMAVTAVRFAIAIITALKPPVTFKWEIVANVLHAQVLGRVFPIIGVAFIAYVLPESPAKTAIWVLAAGGLALYVAETVKIAATNWATNNSAA